jgi:hypothetical protein
MTKTAKCSSCGEYIVWVKTEAEKWMPVDADSFDEGDELLYDKEKHISHFATCPNADSHRRSK